MDHRQALTLANWTPEVAQLFERVREVEPFSAGLCSLAAVLDGCHLVDVAGRGYLAVRRMNHPGGVEIQIAGAVSTDTARAVSLWALPAARRWAIEQGADVVSLATPHATLARAAVRAGFAPAGTILRAVNGH